MKQKFDLSLWLQDKSRKVVTRGGKPVRIVCWDKLGDFPIIACIKYSDDYEDFESYNIDGSKYSYNREDQNDLFFADEEEKLTEFEKKLVDLVSGWCDSHIETPEEYINKHSQTLLDLARKELQPEFETELDKAYKTQDDVVYRNGYAQGKQDTLKETLESLPKWKKITDETNLSLTLSNGEYYLPLEDLEKLPKE